ncbi:MAG: hypothetical protein LBL62_06815 [Planctomycetaceae bacterium]|jgi:hypothetical protein|nr:hypothetical protein [Planctomycetaceae bacterium]
MSISVKGGWDIVMERIVVTVYVISMKVVGYTQAVLKFTKRITEAQQREAVTRGRSLLPYRKSIYTSFLI